MGKWALGVGLWVAREAGFCCRRRCHLIASIHEAAVGVPVAAIALLTRRSNRLERFLAGALRLLGPVIHPGLHLAVGTDEPKLPPR